MKFKLNINMNNAAFEIMPEVKINALLSLVGHRVTEGEVEGKIQDVNGNTVGSFEITGLTI